VRNLTSRVLVLSLLCLVPAGTAFAGGPPCDAADDPSCDGACATETLGFPELEPVVSAEPLDVTATPRAQVEGPGAAPPPPPMPPPPPGYSLVRTLERDIWLPVGEAYVTSIDTTTQSLAEELLPPDVLTATAHQAVDYAPAWLQGELADAFGRLSPGNQDHFAGIILAAADPYVDEIAFTVAHTPAPVLTDGSFYDAIITENVEDLYAIDQDLLYADIVDYGDALTGGDYYSTVRYRIIDTNGDLVEKEFDRDLYYWYIVHPKLSDELATTIDPDAPNKDTPAPPPTGRFWREYIYNSSDPNPHAPGQNWRPLREMLAGCQTLWNSQSNVEGAANGAVGLVSQWMNTVMRYDLPPSNERAIQPVRILHNHCGRCGEQQDLLAAAGRTALIPSVCSSAWANDHVWAEFFENDKWRLWDCSGGGRAVIDPPTYYDHWSNGGVSGVMDWRGDGYIWTVTDKYTPYSTVNVNVTDRLGNPVDGARILLATYFNDGTTLVILVWGYTDSRGHVSFVVGDQKMIFARVDSPIGNFPVQDMQVTRIVNSTEPDMDYTWDCALTETGHGTVPVLRYVAQTPGPVQTDYLLEVAWSVPREILYGGSMYDPRAAFAKSVEPGDVTFFIADTGNYGLYTSGSQFFGQELRRGPGPEDVLFEIQRDGTWYSVLSNQEEMVDTQVLSVTTSLYAWLDDYDGDGIPNDSDNCVEDPNSLQQDSDTDLVGDACDNCPDDNNPGQEDRDGDGRGDLCDACPDDPLDDFDGDGHCAGDDNCPEHNNPLQEDGDTDGAGDACDNCDGLSNPGQEDMDADGFGNDCDNCPGIFNPTQQDSDSDGIGDACQFLDSDGDGIYDGIDNCVDIENPGQEDDDWDLIGNDCDNCPGFYNPGQEDRDGDQAGDGCDCSPDDNSVSVSPFEIVNVVFLDRETLGWDSDEPNSGSTTHYDVLRGLVDDLRRDGDIGRAECIAGGNDVTDVVLTDAELPAGEIFYYLVRGQNACETAGDGTYGHNSAGDDRGVPGSDCL